jgi:aryl carrier-like protein
MRDQLLRIWKDVTQLNDFDFDKSIFELGLDSIKVIDISEQVFNETNIRLEWNEFNVVSTFNETLALLIDKQTNQPLSQP